MMYKRKVAEGVANLLAAKGIRHVFGIIGSANAHLFDAVHNHPDLSLICLHHEQACVMAAHGFYMQSGEVAAVMVTAGAGTTNALTGVVGAWADSVPVLIITGQESSKQFSNVKGGRMIGIQGVFTESIYKTCTKSVVTCKDEHSVLEEVAKAIELSCKERKGPCIVDIPIDLQSKEVDEMLDGEVSENSEEDMVSQNIEEGVAEIIAALDSASKPLLWLGNGLRGVEREVLQEYIKNIGIPYLTSWSGTDLIDPIDSLYAGHAGTYGSRSGNFVLQSCDVLVALGTRLAIPQIGYDESELAREAKIYVVDCDEKQLLKLEKRASRALLADVGYVLARVDELKKRDISKSVDRWKEHVQDLRKRLPIVEECHNNDGWVNSYRFVKCLGEMAPSNATFVTDMGTALISGFQVLEPKGGQRLFTSQGLGEMGYGLPGAIGAWFANSDREIYCLNCDGGLMMNLQDMHSVVSHGIPLKLVIFNNDGYLMIKHTQNAIVGGRRAGTDSISGLTCPKYEPLVKAFGFRYISLRDEREMKVVLQEFMDIKGPVALEVFMDPEQLLVPKLGVAMNRDGSLVSPPLEDLSPLMPYEYLSESLLVEPHEKSKGLERGKSRTQGDAIY